LADGLSQLPPKLPPQIAGNFSACSNHPPEVRTSDSPLACPSETLPSVGELPWALSEQFLWVPELQRAGAECMPSHSIEDKLTYLSTECMIFGPLRTIAAGRGNPF